MNLAHVCACPKPGPGFPMPYIMVFSSVELFEVRGLFVITYVDIDGIFNVDHQFLFINLFNSDDQH